MSALRQAALIFLAVTAVGVTPAGFSAQPAAAADQAATTAGKGESELLMAADLALREGNCRSASDSYLAAAKVSSQVQVARRAAQLALGCEQLSTARVAVARWRELDKYSADAALTAAVVALKRYDPRRGAQGADRLARFGQQRQPGSAWFRRAAGTAG